MFSHGGALRLDVECLECELTDLGADDLGTGDFGEGAESSGLDAECLRETAHRSGRSFGGKAMNPEIPKLPGLVLTDHPGMTRT